MTARVTQKAFERSFWLFRVITYPGENGRLQAHYIATIYRNFNLSDRKISFIFFEKNIDKIKYIGYYKIIRAREKP